MDLYYDRQGNPMTVEEWAEAMAHLFDRVVAKTSVVETPSSSDSQAVEVSTVWLGINHNWTGSGRPIIFETMVFGGPIDQEMWRYATEQEAVAGHREVVRLVQMALQVEEIERR